MQPLVYRGKISDTLAYGVYQIELIFGFLQWLWNDHTESSTKRLKVKSVILKSASTTV